MLAQASDTASALVNPYVQFGMGGVGLVAVVLFTILMVKVLHFLQMERTASSREREKDRNLLVAIQKEHLDRGDLLVGRVTNCIDKNTNALARHELVSGRLEGFLVNSLQRSRNDPQGENGLNPA